MRLLVAVVGACLLMVVPASAEQPLLGTNGKGRVRVLDPDLKIVPGTPALPKTTDGTVLSPDGRRFASWSFYGSRLTVRSTRTFRAIRTLPIERGTEVFWPERDHIVTVDDLNVGKRPNVFRSFDLRSGTSRTVRLRDLLVETQVVGHRLRVLTVGGPDLCCPTGPFRVTDISAAGVVKRRWRVPLPDGFVMGDKFDPIVGMQLSGTLLLASQNERHALIKVHSGETKPIAGLGDGYYGWVGRRLISDFRHIARVDRRAMTVTTVVDTGIEDNTTLFEGGVILGFGRARYDANLQRVAQNPRPAPVQGYRPVLAHGRLYDLIVDCDDSDNTRAAIADAATGAAIAERRGRWKLGVLGGGYMDQPFFEDVCD
ncbi:MAG TPA: hypothetical protein VFX51_18110 [Solirubrobacteraceae bacterium]|nr:hypothetical protein [Solirubrobacteraceae bacterium]